MADFLKQKATTNAVMQTGAGSTREAQQRVTRQSELDKLQRERMAYGLAGKQAEAGAAGQAAQAQGQSNELSEITKAIGQIVSQNGTVPPEIMKRYNELSQGGESGSGSESVPQVDADAFKEVSSAYEAAGYDVGRMPADTQDAWAILKKKHPGYTLPKPAKG
jgi:hypothetical protein